MAYFCIHNSPPIVPNLNQINPVHTIATRIFKIHFDIYRSIEPSGSSLGHDIVLRNERLVGNSFLPLSPGGGYRLRHWSLVAEEKGVGGTPSFHTELSFDFGQ